jgi:putative membrane protein
MMHYWSYGTGYNPVFPVLGFIFQALFWGLIVLLIVKLFRGHSHPHCCQHEMEDNEGDNSLNIIKERYAKGEIDKKEFEQMKKDLE